MDHQPQEEEQVAAQEAAEAAQIQESAEGGLEAVAAQPEPAVSQSAAPAEGAAPLAAAIPSAPPQVVPAQSHSLELVYALGTLGYDLGTEARLDSYKQAMEEDKNPSEPAHLLEHLADNEHAATGIIWTLNLDATPIYALQPAGPYAHAVYVRLREFLQEQEAEGVQRVSAPGIISGSVRLMSGQEVPVIVPELRGMCNWSTEALVKAVLGTPPKEKKALTEYEARAAGITNFLERVYYELRNLGLSAPDRAMNFAATNAFHVAQVFEAAIKDEQELDRIEVERSPVCRPGSECWDVKLTFFNPLQRQAVARKVYRFTIDVSDVVPVTVGEERSWSVY